MSIFENKEAMRLYRKFSDEMTQEQKGVFMARIQELFDAKCVSEEGEYDCFKITSDDLMQLATTVAVAN